MAKNFKNSMITIPYASVQREEMEEKVNVYMRFFMDVGFMILKSRYGLFSLEKKQLTETGCTLSFGLNDHGYMAIMLHPGKTDYTSQLETCIFIKNFLHPKKLLNDKFLERLWRYFNSYMEVTSIDGKPRLIDRARVFYLRNFKNKVIDGKYHSKPVVLGMLNSFKFALNVGLSGFLIYLLTEWPNDKTKDQNNDLRHITDSLEIENRLLKKELKN